MKSHERARARQLRSEHGLSVKTIASQLGVSRSSVSVWVRDIELTDTQQELLAQSHRMIGAQLKGSKRNAEKHLELRKQYQSEGRIKAKERDALHIAGCMLFWAEGKKSRNSLKMVNSDPDMLTFYMRFIRQSLGVKNEQISVHLHVYTGNGLTIQEIERFWLETLDLPSTSLRKSTVDRKPISSSQRGRKLPYGVCVINVYNTRLVQHVYGAIQEYIGIDKPEWLA